MFYYIGDKRRPEDLSYQQRVKEKNIKRIFDLLRCGECESRAELVRAMSLSATSISALVEELHGMGYLEESGPKHTAQPGRRPIRLLFNENARTIVNFSLYQRGIRYSLLNLRCEVLETIFVEYDSRQCKLDDAGQCYSERFMDILNNHSRLYDPVRVVCIGISIPGVYGPRSQTFYMNSSISVRFSRQSMIDFQRQTGIPVYLANTTMCQAYTEKKYLDAQDNSDAPVQHLVYVNVCDGVGASVISNGNLFLGPDNNAGEMGHMTIDIHGLPCACGNRGCLERYVNLNAILDSCREACAEAGLEGPDTFEALAKRFQDIPAVDQKLYQVAEYLASGIYNMICAIGIQHIILGGGIELLGEHFLEQLRELTRAHSKQFCDNLKLDYASAGSMADDVGLAHYYLDKVYTITY